MATPAETLTRYFYLWERRGRGWQYHDAPVSLEPPFVPFHPQSAIRTETGDDGVHPTFLHFLYRSLFPRAQADPLANMQVPAPRALGDADLCIFNVSLPRSLDLDGFEAEQVLLMLSYCTRAVSFEVVGTYNKIDIQVACAETDAELVLSQLKIYYPTCTILETADAVSPDAPSVVIEFGLAQEFMRPLAFADRNQPSMYLGMKGIFDTLRQNECVCIQILFQGTKAQWTKSILRSVTDGYGDSFFADAPEMPKLAQKKVSSQLFGVVVRLLIASPTGARRDMLIQHAGHAVMTQSSSQYNSLVPMPNDGYDADLHLEDLLARRSRRFGMLLNTEELATFVHVPDDGGMASALSHSHLKTKELPAELRNHAHVLGVNSHQGIERDATVSGEQRNAHTHVVGSTGTGKSTFLLGQIAQDIRNGIGVAVLDPHGDLIEAVLKNIPRHRLRDVVLIDPSDPEYSVGFNILRANSELEKEVLSSDLVSVFQRFSTSWGDQMTSVLANAILAFLESTEGGTLADVKRFLLETDYRASVLKTVSDPSILYYWTKEFPIIKHNSIGSILTRLDSFLRPKPIRHMVSQKDGLNFADILNSQKILLVKLSQGLIGESNSYLLGSLIVSKIHQTALGRQSMEMEERSQFILYADEFHNFICPSISRILSGGRKYKLGLVLAHQSLEQISNSNSELASSLVANAGIRVCFRLGENDAQKLEKGFASFTSEDLLNLGTGQAICRVGRSDMDFNLSVPKQIVSSSQYVSVNEVIQASRKKYGVLRSTLDPAFVPTEQRKDEPIQETKTVIAPPEPKDEPPLVKETMADVKVIDDPKLIEDIVRRKEESRHRYLQMLIKRNAESRGYKAVIEQQTKDGKGRVDVVLQKGKITYAIEIGVTTSKDWEVHNIEKCLADGYERIFALSEDMKGADLMTRKLTEAGILPKSSGKVSVYDITGFMGVLDRDDVKDAPKTKTIKGYRVKVEYRSKNNF
jgi:hypothetical protein